MSEIWDNAVRPSMAFPELLPCLALERSGEHAQRQHILLGAALDAYKTMVHLMRKKDKSSAELSEQAEAAKTHMVLLGMVF